jgi:hypothetical protein
MQPSGWHQRGNTKGAVQHPRHRPREAFVRPLVPRGPMSLRRSAAAPVSTLPWLSVHYPGPIILWWFVQDEGGPESSTVHTDTATESGCGLDLEGLGSTKSDSSPEEQTSRFAHFSATCRLDYGM